MDDLIGKKFGFLTAVEATRFNGRKAYKCVCDCGGSKNVTKSDLTAGKVRSCGCLRRKDIVGNTYGYLTVVAESDLRNNERRRMWECQCICGKVVFKDTKALTDGDCRSCGCRTTELRIACGNLVKHHMCETKLYRTWTAMRNRCSDPNTPNYMNYGGRGISVCSEWQEFNPFMEWSYENGYTEHLTIDRIDVNGNYCPSNCRWVDWRVQANNKRTNRYIEYKNERHTVAEWARLVGILPGTLRGRIDRGWDVEKALFTPPMSGAVR